MQRGPRLDSGQIVRRVLADLRSRRLDALVCRAVWRGSAVKYRVDEQKSEEMAWQYSKFYPGAATGLEEVLHDILPERPALPHFERWYAAIAARKAFKDQVAAVPLS